MFYFYIVMILAGTMIFGRLIATPKKRRKTHRKTPKKFHPKPPQRSDFSTTSQTVVRPEQTKTYIPEFAGKSMAEKKGRVGEQIIKVQVLSKLQAPMYAYFDNLIIPNHRNGSTQIDNLIVSPFGIFVIEAKYYQGWIYGSEDRPTWTQTFPSGKKYPLANPLHQNYGHIKALAHLFRLPEHKFHSVIVFTERTCQIKTELPPNVCLVKDFIAHIQSYQQEILNAEQQQAICTILQNPEFIATPDKLAQHIQTITHRFSGSLKNH